MFAVDKTKLVRLEVPPHLLMPVSDLQIDDSGKLKLDAACVWSKEAKEFYLGYMSSYSLTNEMLAQMLDEQAQRFNMPNQIKEMLVSYGVDKNYFDEPSYSVVLDKFKLSRRIAINNQLYLMPVVELVNHSGKSKNGFKLSPNIGFQGNFKEEILVNYGVQADSMLLFTAFGFSEINPYVFSGTFSLNLGAVNLNVARVPNIHQAIDQVKAPQLKFDGRSIDLSFLLVANSMHKSSPKVIFNKLMQQVNMPNKLANEVFDGIVEQNIGFLKALNTELKHVEGSVASSMKIMLKNQLHVYGVYI